MMSAGWRWFSVCLVACGLWIGAQAASDDADALDSPSASRLDKKGMDNMQYFGRLGKRVYGDDGDKRLDPSMFGRLGKRADTGDLMDESSLLENFEDSAARKRYDSRAYFGRLGKRHDSLQFLGKLGKRNIGKEELSQLLADLSKRGVDGMAYIGRLGKRPYDFKQFYGRLG